MLLPRATFDATAAHDLPDTSGIGSSIVRKHGGFAISRSRPVSHRADAPIAASHKNDHPLNLQTGFRVPQGILPLSPSSDMKAPESASHQRPLPSISPTEKAAASHLPAEGSPHEPLQSTPLCPATDGTHHHSAPPTRDGDQRAATPRPPPPPAPSPTLTHQHPRPRWTPPPPTSKTPSLVRQWKRPPPAVSRQAVLVASAPNCFFQVLVPR
jgi:hypothetical protein